MEPEGSLPHSQVPTNWPYPEPARSSPYPHTSLPEDQFYIILPQSKSDSKKLFDQPGRCTPALRVTPALFTVV